MNDPIGMDRMWEGSEVNLRVELGGHDVNGDVRQPLQVAPDKRRRWADGAVHQLVAFGLEQRRRRRRRRRLAVRVRVLRVVALPRWRRRRLTLERTGERLLDGVQREWAHSRARHSIPARTSFSLVLIGTALITCRIESLIKGYHWNQLHSLESKFSRIGSTKWR